MSLKREHKLAVSLLNLFSKTWRYKVHGPLPPKPAIIAFWHGLMLPGWNIFKPHNPVGIVSQSKDGAILSALLEKWNFTLIRGSSSKGGREVITSAIRQAPENYLLVTPDGPRGPIHEFKPGATVIAKKTRVPLFLCGIEIKSKRIFNKSWDLFQLPLPFSRVDFHFSEPIYIPQDISRDKLNELNIELAYQLRKLSGYDS
jgi:lysophospholipid acyltransferase (LPLAT)-like uncharacterized protein